MKTLATIFALTLFLSATAARDEKAADIQGSVDKVNAGTEEQKKKGNFGSIFVEGDKVPKLAYDKATIRIDKATKIVKQVGKEQKDASFDDLKKGGKVSVWFTGPVAESYPVQAKAGKIVILEEAK